MTSAPVLLLALSVALAADAAAQATAPDAHPAPAAPGGHTTPAAPLAWLVGGVWTADASTLGPGMRRIETRYQWSDNGAFVRFTTHFVSDRGELKNYDGNFFWNAAAGSFGMWYTDARSAITEGPVTVSDTGLQILFRSTDFAGKPADLRVDVVRQTSDLYRWTLAEKAGDGWKQLATLAYARKPGA